MNKTFFLSLLFLTFYSSQAMDWQGNDCLAVPDKMLAQDEVNAENTYFDSLEQTATRDDEKKQISIKKALFAQLCVQASKAHNLDQRPFFELLQRIKENIIDIEQGIVEMTEKDAYHRLMSYIPMPDARRAKCMINGKKVSVSRILKTEVVDDVQDEQLKYLKDNQNIIEQDFPLDLAWLAYDPALVPQNRKIVRVTDGAEISSLYNFESDEVHHAKMLEEFRVLMAGI